MFYSGISVRLDCFPHICYIFQNHILGDLGKAIAQNVEELEFNPRFKIIGDSRVALRQLSPEVQNDLSCAQQYGYRMTRMITTGIGEFHDQGDNVRKEYN
jgi:hypothetical protein